MKSDKSAAKSQELPEKVTFVWLFRHVPIQGWMALLGLLVSAGLIGISIGKSPLVTSSDCPNSPLPEVRITSPRHLSPVGKSVNAAGTRNFIADQSIWVAIFSYQVDRYFPHRFPARLIGDSGWSSPDLQVVNPNGDTAKFDIVVFLVDNSGRKGLREYFNSQNREGLRSPLAGMIEQDRVTITSSPRI